MSPKSCIQMFFFQISGERRTEGCDSNQYRKPHWQDDRLKDNDIQLLCFKTDSVVFFVQSVFLQKKSMTHSQCTNDSKNQ